MAAIAEHGNGKLFCLACHGFHTGALVAHFRRIDALDTDTNPFTDNGRVALDVAAKGVAIVDASDRADGSGTVVLVVDSGNSECGGQDGDEYNC